MPWVWHNFPSLETSYNQKKGFMWIIPSYSWEVVHHSSYISSFDDKKPRVTNVLSPGSWWLHHCQWSCSGSPPIGPRWPGAGLWLVDTAASGGGCEAGSSVEAGTSSGMRSLGEQWPGVSSQVCGRFTLNIYSTGLKSSRNNFFCKSEGLG